MIDRIVKEQIIRAPPSHLAFDLEREPCSFDWDSQLPSNKPIKTSEVRTPHLDLWPFKNPDTSNTPV